jgi:dihydrofolate reductase
VAKMLWSLTTSLDGFSAGPDGDMSWLADFLGPNPTVDELIPQIGSLLVGRNTYGGDDPHKGGEGEGKAFGGGWEGMQFVLTHHAPDAPVDGVTFVDNLDDAISGSKAAAGEKYVNVLGANVARQLLDIGLLDEILVFIAPVLLGDGVRMFDFPGGTNIKLERLRLTAAPLASALWFRVVR